MKCWGRGQEGQAEPPCVDSWLRACAGQLHTCGIHSDLTIECWGSNDAGQGNVPHKRGTCVAGTNELAECDTIADCTGGGKLNPQP
ncbi:hypothetical protein T484DRAFT_1859090 [Baffinella frigidus]|nr:hypothetical protein T484DRAFT_1859090 [Cryptophyta sp. CCMP2293]